MGTKEFSILSAIALAAALSLPRSATAGPDFGVMADLGVPDGATASLVVQPISMLRLHGGVGYNLIAPGVRAGASLVPVPWLLSPSINVEAGHYFRGDANRAVNMFGDSGEEDDVDSPVLRDVGYQYANFHLGVDFGRSRVTWYLHAGMSAIRGEIRNLDEEIASDDEDMDGPTVEFRENPVVTLWVPSARTGFIVYF